MENRRVQYLDQLYGRELEEKIKCLEVDLSVGKAPDYAAYQNLCGQICGIRFAMDKLIELRGRLGKEEDFGA